MIVIAFVGIKLSGAAAWHWGWLWLAFALDNKTSALYEAIRSRGEEVT